MFEILFTQSALKDLQYLSKKEQKRVLKTVDAQLKNEPLKPTRNRKPLQPNDLSAWEVRAGTLRIFYDVSEADEEVTIKAVGWKDRNKLFIRGQEFEL